MFSTARETSQAHSDALVDSLFADMPDWQEQEARAMGDVLSERDFPLSDPEPVSDEDWSAFFEMTWSDPAERAM